MKVLFRVDSSFEMGMGHLMRCLTLASALRERGSICRFVCRNHAGASLGLIRERGFEVHVLPLEADAACSLESLVNHASWVGGSVLEDAKATFDVVRGDPPAWVVVDHYGLDATWEAVMNASQCRVMVIDDLANRSHICELLLDQTPGRIEDDYAPWLRQQTEMFLGSRFALLRPEFAEHRDAALRRRSPGCIDHVLVSMGGSDPDGVTAQAIEALEVLPAQIVFRVTAVMNSQSPALDAVRQSAARASRETAVLCDVTDMASLMIESDFAIGGAGTTSWERCCLGLPSILAVLADNQQLVAHRLEAAGAATVLRNFRRSDAGKRELASALLRFLESPPLVSDMALAAARLVDGKGVDRVADALREAA